MKEIYTFWGALSLACDVEGAINEKLAEGWQIVRREIIPCPADPCKSVLFYELERDFITEDEKTCENCRHYDRDGNVEPCASCTDGEKWEVET